MLPLMPCLSIFSATIQKNTGILLDSSIFLIVNISMFAEKIIT
jgi:hypothetical protein